MYVSNVLMRYQSAAHCHWKERFKTNCSVFSLFGLFNLVISVVGCSGCEEWI